MERGRQLHMASKATSLYYFVLDIMEFQFPDKGTYSNNSTSLNIFFIIKKHQIKSMYIYGQSTLNTVYPYKKWTGQLKKRLNVAIDDFS